MDYHDEVMQERGSLTKVDKVLVFLKFWFDINIFLKELIVVATSGLNRCLYCVVAHGAILRIYAKNKLISDVVALDHLKAPITNKQKLMLDYAVKLV